MIFSIMKDKEITKKAHDLDTYYTAEFATGYMMTHYPMLFILDIFIPTIILFGIMWLFCI